MVIILEVCVKKIVASSVLVSLNFLSNVYFGDLLMLFLSYVWLFDISADVELQQDSSGGEEVDDVALGKLIEVIGVIGNQHHCDLFCFCLKQFIFAGHFRRKWKQ